jgi:hypothetical protein
LDHTTANLTLRGVVSHLVGDWDPTYYYPWESRSFFVTRSLYIGEVLYTLSPYKLAFNDLVTLAPMGEIILNPGFTSVP